MQVKKFEAPTIQEALEVIKRELGPEAIILNTRKMRKGFGLMSKESVEVTAAVSERSLQKKSFVENRLREPDKETVKRLPAERQGNLYDKFAEKAAGGPSSRPRNGAASTKAARSLTATRYADIDDSPVAAGASSAVRQAQLRARGVPAASASAPAGAQSQAGTLEAVASGRISREAAGAIMGQLGAGMSVEEELRHLKRMIEEMKTTQESAPAAAAVPGTVMSTPALQDAFDQLVVNGIDRRHAMALVKKTAFEIGEERSLNPEYVLDQLAVEIMNTTEILNPLLTIQPGARPEGSGPRVIALVGPTGVGKTTTVAKLASEALLKRGLKVGLVNLDGYRVAAFDQLGTYAKILNVPFRSVENAEELRMAIRDFTALDVVLVDTTGRSQRDPGPLKEMDELITAGAPEAQTHLVLSVTTRDSELYDQASRFAVFRPQGIILSKLDEATTYGSIYNVLQRAKVPLLYFTTGQRVPEDIEEATRERVAALIMDL